MKIITNPTLSKDKRNAAIAFGNFDGVHLGHKQIVDNVQRIALQEGIDSAILTFEPHPRKFFNINVEDFYLTNLEQKVSAIESCDIDLFYIMDFTKEFSQLSAEDFIKDILLDKCNARYIIIGNSCTFGKDKAGNVALLRKLSTVYNYQLIQLNILEFGGKICSSSEIRELLKIGEVAQANELLGRPYKIKGRVLEGEQRGRQIGFPTINMCLEGYVKPKLGVYFAKVYIDNEAHYGVVNVGNKPTFHNNYDVILEMHIFDITRDLYGEMVEVQILHFIRSELKFHGVEELKRQIKQDIVIAKQIKDDITLKGTI